MYRRVSTDEQADSRAGLDAQESAIRAEAARRGWPIVAEYVDVASGAKDLAARPGGRAALLDLSQGRADVLLGAKLDRLSRSVRDFAVTLERASAEGWAIVALDVLIDTTTPIGEAMASMALVFAQLERKRIGERTREALAAKRAAGVRLGRPRQIPEVVRERILGQHAAGRSLTAIAADLTTEGVPTVQGGQRWYPSTVRAVVMAPDQSSPAAAGTR